MGVDTIIAKARYFLQDAERCASPWLVTPLRQILDHETMGGHTFTRHVAIKYRDLQSRLSTYQTLPAVSSFWDLKAAHASTCYLAMANLSALISWTQGTTNRLSLVGQLPARAPIGYALVRGDRKLRMCRSARMILQRLPGPDIFIVLTVYPTV